MKCKRSLKKIGVVLAGFILLFAMMTTVYAADSGVSYNGYAASTVFGFAPDDLFQNFKGMMPGDTRDQNIVVNNNSGNLVKVYLRGEPVEESVAQFLSKVTIGVKNSNGDVLAPAATANTTWPAGGTDQYYMLGEISPGDSETLIATINVPIELGNEFQNAIGKVRWIFMVQEYEPEVIPSPSIPLGDPSPIPTPTSAAPSPTKSGGTTIIVDDDDVPLGPKTGDDSQIWIWAVALIVLSLALTLLLAKNRKRTNNR